MGDHMMENHEKKRKMLLLRAAMGPRFFSKMELSASMTIEASLVLPFFLFLFVNIMAAFLLLRLQCDMEAAFHQAGTKLALRAFYVRYAAGEMAGTDDSDQAGAVLAAASAPSLIRRYLGDDYLSNSLIEGDISFLQTGMALAGGDDIIDIIGSYEVHPLFNLVRWKNFTMQTRFYGHAWTGYDLEDEAHPEDEHSDELVYITEHGTVYHRSLNCTHLKLSVQAVDMAKARGMTNTMGNRYTPCEYCGSRKTEGQVYITNFGDRYHCSINCTGIKRTIYTVPISQVGGRGPCSACAGGE